MAKSSQAFRTIREVADWLDVKAHVLRFWESKFPQIRPVKRAGGRRYYRPGDMELVGGIKVLLHEQGMTIKGVQDLIRDEGTVHVCALSPPIDTLDFEDAPSDEIAAWDRELAGDGVEEADIIAQAQPPAATDPEPIAELPLAEPPVASEIGAPVFPETAASMEEPRATVSETDAGQPDAEEPSREPMTAPDAMEAGLDLDTELAGIEDTPAGTTPEFMPAEPEFAFDSGQDNAPPEREEEPLLVDLDAPFSGMPEPEPEPKPVVPAPAPEAAPPDAGPETDLNRPEPAAIPEGPGLTDTVAPSGTPTVEDATPAAMPDTADQSERPMIALMADFAELTARIPALSETERAALAPLIARSADLAARLSA